MKKFIQKIRETLSTKREQEEVQPQRATRDLDDTLIRKTLTEYDLYLSERILGQHRNFQLEKIAIILERINVFVDNIESGKASEQYISKRKAATERALASIYRLLYFEETGDDLLHSKKVNALLNDANERLANPNILDRLVDWDVIKMEFPGKTDRQQYMETYDLLKTIGALLGEDVGIREKLLARLNNGQVFQSYRICSEMLTHMEEIAIQRGSTTIQSLHRVLRILVEYGKEQGVEFAEDVSRYSRN